MTDEGYVCKKCGAESWVGGFKGDTECEHDWGMVWTTEKD